MNAMGAPEAMGSLLAGAEPGAGAGVQTTRKGELDKALGTAVFLGDKKPKPSMDETRVGGAATGGNIGQNMVNQAQKPTAK